MSEVLVLVDHVEGEIKKATFELLTAARALGEPSAVVVGAPNTAGKLVDALREHGAEKIYVAESDSADFLTPQVGVLAALVERIDPVAVLIATSADGKEIAGRLAVRTGSAWLNDVVAVAPGRAIHTGFGSRRPAPPTRFSAARGRRGRPRRPPTRSSRCGPAPWSRRRRRVRVRRRRWTCLPRTGRRRWCRGSRFRRGTVPT